MITQQLRVMFYVQHLLGIGHLMRASRIAIALQRDGLHVTLVCGGVPVQGFEVPGVTLVALPSIAVRDGNFKDLVDANGNLIDEDYKQRRCQLLLDTYENTQPDIVILEAFPFGRRLVRFELLPLINAINTSRPKPILLTSIRDILQKRSKPGRDEQSVELVKQHFDKVLVHADPAITTLDDSFALAHAIADQIIYTGLVCGPPGKTLSDSFDIVVSAGGGAVGVKLVQASISAAALLPENLSWCVLTGPNLPAEEFTDLSKNSPANVTIERFRIDFPDLLHSTTLSISQAGYNTVSDVLQANCRSLLVPFTAFGETEQADRAEQLRRLGLAHVISEESLSAKQLALSISNILSQNGPIASSAIKLDGAESTARILRDLIETK